MDDHEALTRSTDEFRKRLVQIADDQWDLPTGCGDWTVRELVRHVLAGNLMVGMLEQGATADEVLAMFQTDVLGDDTVAAWDHSVVVQADAFRVDAVLEQVWHHPAFDMPAGMVMGFRLVDPALHAWDLARAIGVDDQLDTELMEVLYAQMAPMADMLAGSGVFGQGSGGVGDDADVQTKVLDMSGRRP